jgi:hypothetical protein
VTGDERDGEEEVEGAVPQKSKLRAVAGMARRRGSTMRMEVHPMVM